MTFNDVLGLSFRNLRQSKLRTALTTLGVSIGIASLAGMVSLGVGLQDQVVGRFTQSGLFGSITVTPQADLPGGLAQLSRPGGGRGGLRGRGAQSQTAPAVPGTEAKLDDDAIKRLASLPNVRDVTPSLRIPVQIVFGDFTRPAPANGVPMSSKGEGPFQTFAFGQFFASESDEACMLGLDMAKRIAEQDPGSLIGKNLTLSYAATGSGGAEGTPESLFQVRKVERPCRIVGIVERDSGPVPGGLGGSPLAGVMIPMGMAKAMDAEVVTSAQALFRGPEQTKTYNAITVKVTQAQHTQDVEEQIRKMGYTAFSLDDALRGAKNAFLILDILLSLIGSIALTVSSLGIVNTMVMSILERTREIGIMKAIGASNNDVRRIFLVEASAIGLLGGLLGVALGWVVGKAINFGANIYIQSQGGTPGTLFSLPLWLVASAIGFSIMVSLAAGSYPASRAARLDPIQALRHD